MPKELWFLAVISQLWGVTTALLGVIGHFWTTVEQPEANTKPGWILVPFVATYGVFAFAVLWTMDDQPSWQFLGLEVSAPTLVAVGAYINSFSLALLVFLAGGVHGIFTPLFLLVPHTSAVFLSRTNYQANVFVIFLLTLVLYQTVYYYERKRTIVEGFYHSLCTSFVLADLPLSFSSKEI